MKEEEEALNFGCNNPQIMDDQLMILIFFLYYKDSLPFRRFNLPIINTRIFEMAGGKSKRKSVNQTNSMELMVA